RPYLAAGVVSDWAGNTNEASTGSELVNVTMPVQFVQVTGYINRTCGLTSEGKIYCWGDNTYGELGDGSTTPRLVPTNPVDTSNIVGDDRFTQVAVGDTH